MNKEEILANIGSIEVPTSISSKGDQELVKSYQISSYISDYMSSTIDEKVQNTTFDEAYITRELDRILDSFYENAISNITEMREELMSNSETNIYTFSGTEYLALANQVSRKISTWFGAILEDIALISPKCFSTEREFSLKLKGVDIIFKDENGELVFTQLKTAKNTLTGGKTQSVINELSVFPKAMFVACFDLGGWTFSPKDSGITRIAGEQFWNLIDMPYDLIGEKVTRVMNRIESELS